MIEITADFSNSADFAKQVHRFAAYQSKSVGEVVKAQARLVAVNLAHNTQPYGADEAARFKGKNAVRRDLDRVFIARSRVLQIAENGARNGNSASLALLKAVNNRNSEKVRIAWQILTNKPVVVESAPDKSFHKSQRDKRGRVRRNARSMIVLSDAKLYSYENEKERLVGFAKSGWSACAKELGGTRGIPGWVSRNKGPGSVRDATGDKDSPHVVLSNRVSYVDQVLPQSEIQKAVSMQTEKMIRALEHQFDADARRAGLSA